MFGSFSSKFSLGKAQAALAVQDPNVTTTTPGTTTPVYGSGGAAWNSTSDNALVNAGYTLLVSATADDATLQVNLPFTFYLYGTASTVLYVGSNTYITLNNGSTSYSGLRLSSPVNPPYPALHLGSSDNSWQRVWWKNNTTNLSIRYEGNNTTTGVGGSPGIVYETTFYPSNGTNQYVQIKFGTHSRTSGVFGVTDGIGTNYLNFGTIQPNTDYVLKTDTTGNNPVFYTGIYTP